MKRLTEKNKTMKVQKTRKRQRKGNITEEEKVTYTSSSKHWVPVKSLNPHIRRAEQDKTELRSREGAYKEIDYRAKKDKQVTTNNAGKGEQRELTRKLKGKGAEKSNEKVKEEIEGGKGGGCEVSARGYIKDNIVEVIFRPPSAQ